MRIATLMTRSPSKLTCTTVSFHAEAHSHTLQVVTNTLASLVAQMKGKQAQANAGAPDLAELSISDSPRAGGASKSASPPPPARPPRPAPVQRQDTEEDDDDPFGDSNVVETPAIEKGQPRW